MTNTDASASQSWLPMTVIALAQFLLSFNVAALPISIGPMVASFGTAPTTVGTAIVVYSLFVAAFIMLGAKLGQMFGSLRVFRVAVVLFGAAMAVVAVSPGIALVIAAQGVAGLTAAALVPTLVVLIAANYDGPQQARALGYLGSAGAGAAVLGFLLGGALGTLASWRLAFALLVPVAALVFVLGGRLKPVERLHDVTIDAVGVVLAAAAILFLSIGFETLTRWGMLFAKPSAPWSLLGLSPAPLLILGGIMLGQGFFAWARRRVAAGKSPLLALEVVESRGERAAITTLFIIIVVEACISFLVPLYIMIVQGKSSLDTGLTMMPFNLAIFFAAMLVVQLFGRIAPAHIARLCFVAVAAGLVWLALVMRNDWNTLPVIIGLVVIGAGQGGLLTLLFNVLVTASPRQFAGDVGSLRGTANNLAFSVGTALAGTLAVGLLSATVMANLSANPLIPAHLQAEVDLDSINFVSNEQLTATLTATGASAESIDEAVRINSEARLRALKLSFLLLSGLALLAIVPAGALPGFHPDDD